MMKRLAGVVLGMMVLGAGSAAWAGERSITPVYIDTTNRILWGSFGSAHNSSDSVQHLQVLVQASAAIEVAVIYARDANGVSVSCFTASAPILSAVKALTSDAFVQASWDASGECTTIEVRTTSVLPPKTL